MNYESYIKPEFFVLIPVLYVFGTMLKRSVIDDRWIPILLGLLGTSLVIAYELAGGFPDGTSGFIGVIFSGITQGILCAAGSVYTNNIIKQFCKKEGKNEIDSKDDCADD